MLKNRRVILLALFLSSSLLAILVWRQSSERHMLSEVYSQVIVWNPKFVESVSVRCNASQGLFFISKSGTYPIPIKENWQEVSSRLPLLQEKTWINFLEANSESSDFPSNLDLGCNYALLNPTEYELAYSSHCPIYSFSRIGLNRNRSQALVFVNQSCGTFTGGGLYLLDLVGGQWKVRDTMAIFMN